MSDRLEGSEYEKQMPELPPLEKDAKPARKRKSRAQIEAIWIVRREDDLLEDAWAFLTEEAATEAFEMVQKLSGLEGMSLHRVPVWKS